MLLPRIQHRANVGATRTGKSYAKLNELVALLNQRPRPSIWLFDPANSIAEPLTGWAERFAVAPVIVDHLEDFDRAPGYNLLVPNDDRNPYKRESANNVVVEDLIALAVKNDQKLNAAMSPNIQDGLVAAFTLALNQRAPVTFRELQHVFSAGPEQTKLFDNCTLPSAILPFLAWNDLPPREWVYICSPAARRLRTLAREPAFAIRDGATFDVADFVNRGGLWLGMGSSSNGDVSRNAVSQVLGTVLLMLISLARRGKFTRKLIIVIDEGNASGLIDQHVSRALAEAGKWGGGVEIHFIAQNLMTLEEKVRDDIVQNCGEIKFFKHLEPKATRYGAEMLAGPEYDPLRVKRVVETRRQERVDEEERTITNSGSWASGDQKGSSTSLNTVFRPIYEERIDSREDLLSPEEQIRLRIRDLGMLSVGECLTRSFEGIFKQVIPAMPDPWTGRLRRNGEIVPLWKVRAEEWLKKLKSGPGYRSTLVDSRPCPPPSTPDAASRLDAGEL